MIKQRRISDTKNRLIDSIVDHAKGLPLRAKSFDIESYMRQYFRSVSAEVLQERSAQQLCELAMTHLKAARVRPDDEIIINIFNPDEKNSIWPADRTVLQTVCTDMAFIIDTITMILNELDRSIFLNVHPILRVKRNKNHTLKQVFGDDETGAGLVAESFAHFEFDRFGNQQEIEEFNTRLAQAMQDVRASTRDWQAMRDQASFIANELRETPSVVREKERLETAALLDWMVDDHFTFLGYREYRLNKIDSEPVLKTKGGSGLGILTNPKSQRIKIDNPNIQKGILSQVNSKSPLIITKANRRSTVHRSVHMDYIGVKRFDKNGRATREQRFLGLFTSAAYNHSPRDIPYLRLKVQKVMDSFGLPSRSHASKALMHILESFPRDELFQSSIEDLKRVSEGVLSLQEQQRVRMFIRRDPYRRFISCMIFVPKEKYNTAVREKIESILLEGFDGESIDSQVLISESSLARLQCIVATPPTRAKRNNLPQIEKEIAAAVQTWQGSLREELCARCGHDLGVELFDRYGTSFSAAYEEDFSPYEATFDIARIAKIDADENDMQMALYRPPSFAEDHLRFKIFQLTKPIPISDVLPMLENMGMKVISERPYKCRVADDRNIYVQEFEMVSADGCVLDPVNINQRFQDTFINTRRGVTESDGFNNLVINAGLSWRETALLRAYCRYLLQTGLPFSQLYMEQLFRSNPEFAKLWITAFQQKFDPSLSEKMRAKKIATDAEKLNDFINQVKSADEDRIFRGFRAALKATLRTNFFQVDENGTHKSYVSFKLTPKLIPGVPKPLPMYEVFVYSARMEGIHLRGGMVARGGLRWSDRREDFRTEVLGLMKAQKVKNTVIVPTGAKGGFVCKHLPKGDRESVQAEVIACYKTLIFGLLDITDNIVNDTVVPPTDVVRHDGDDPYLVVAADKGTATFSDIANGVAQDYGFWLDDAFASGGSVGYDHKGMGITAKGAWEAVKRHFREMGINTQEEIFTVSGVGDMSGDVFGNGLLHSKTMKLLAAFNHMHIFLDPDPDPVKSFNERERLFGLPRSGWDDYDGSLISKGGGVYGRDSKSIPVSKAAKKMLDLSDDNKDPTPTDVIKAILRMQVDLFWNGGIGTYVKASSESHHDAGDRSNDAVRINGEELRCRIVGEGGNLGFTQLGRVEYALNDGRINTDFIDNAGGVNCSDREVNIKILLNLVASKTKLNQKSRNQLLAKMTDEVEQLVLKDNYFQTQAISTLESDAVSRSTEHMGFIRSLTQKGELDRELEYLPSDSEILERRQNSKGLTRPELSILLSYGKINLINQLSQSDELDNDFTREDLKLYFPIPLQKKYAKYMGQHRLAKEIIATQTANSLVNRMGPNYVVRTQEETGASAGEIARAYTIARETLNLRPLWRNIESLDNQIQAKAQYKMLGETSRLLRRASIWLLQRPQFSTDTRYAITTFEPVISNMAENLTTLLRGPSLEKFEESRDIYIGMGVTKNLAQKMAGIRYLYSGYDIALCATQLKRDDQFVAHVYYRLARGLRVTWLRDQIEELPVRGRWQALARGTLRESLYEIQRAATIQAVSGSKQKDDRKVAENWLNKNSTAITRAQRVVTDMRSMGSMDFATLSVAIQEMRKLVQS